MGSLLIVTGPPGAGKSTVATELAARAERSVLVEGDAFFGFLAAGRIEPWLPASHDQNTVVTDASGATAGRFAAGGYTTIFDGILGPWFLPTFTAASGLDALDYVMLMPSLTLCKERVARRSREGFRDLGATEKMHHEFATSSIEERHVLPVTVATPASLADTILTAQLAGDLRITP